LIESYTAWRHFHVCVVDGVFQVVRSEVDADATALAALRHNRLRVADTQQQDAASLRLLRAGQRRRSTP
jgi:hypothetical protein